MRSNRKHEVLSETVISRAFPCVGMFRGVNKIRDDEIIPGSNGGPPFSGRYDPMDTCRIHHSCSFTCLRSPFYVIDMLITVLDMNSIVFLINITYKR